MTYAAYPKPILGPCRCMGCGDPLWWAERMSRKLGLPAMRVGWREEDGILHRCPELRAAVAAHFAEIEKPGRRRAVA